MFDDVCMYCNYNQLHLVYDSIWDWSFRSILYIPLLFGGRKTTMWSSVSTFSRGWWSIWIRLAPRTELGLLPALPHGVIHCMGFGYGDIGFTTWFYKPRGCKKTSILPAVHLAQIEKIEKRNHLLTLVGRIITQKQDSNKTLLNKSSKSHEKKHINWKLIMTSS